MTKFKENLRIGVLIISIALYLSLIISQVVNAEPAGADLTNPSSEEYTTTADSRTDSGGTIVTLSTSVTQQDDAWKAYVGNITGTLVLRDSDGWSIFEWSMNSSTFGGNVFVSRNDSINWSNLKCANNTIIDSEQSFLGMSSTDSDSLNQTFNYTTHKTMTVSGVGPISNSTCPSVATYVNGSAQTITESSYFQEILLTDNNNLIYGTFIDQDAWGFDNNESVNGTNVTYDFQLIVAENSSLSSGNTYYFYADISS